jgi:hypothetical protein
MLMEHEAADKAEFAKEEVMRKRGGNEVTSGSNGRNHFGTNHISRKEE